MMLTFIPHDVLQLYGWRDLCFAFHFLDHIFFSNSLADLTFESSTLFTEELTVRDFWGQSQKTWLSDHAGIMVIVD